MVFRHFKKLKQKFIYTFYGFLVYIIFFLLVEITVRVFVDDTNRDTITSVEKNVYVTDQKKLTEFEKKAFTDYMHKTVFGNKRTAEVIFSSFIKNNKIPEKEVKIWVFGGSTSEGTSISSWPREFEKLGTHLGFQVRNFSEACQQSDFSIEKLKNNICRENVPDYVFWANWFNEYHIVHYGPLRNKDKLFKAESDPIQLKAKRYFVLRKTKDFFFRVDATFEKYSKFYSLMSRSLRKKIFLSKLSDSKSNFDDMISEPASDNDAIIDLGISLSIKNYDINLQEALALGEKYNFKLILVSLPYSPNIFYNEKNTFYFILEKGKRHSNEMIIRENLLFNYVIWSKAFEQYTEMAAARFNLQRIDVQQFCLDNNSVVDWETADNLESKLNKYMPY